jgi:hypothetical protein
VLSFGCGARPWDVWDDVRGGGYDHRPGQPTGGARARPRHSPDRLLTTKRKSIGARSDRRWPVIRSARSVRPSVEQVTFGVVVGVRALGG